jgi:regulator of ribosome biosynthesis
MEDAVLAQLPPPAFRLPREKPVPEQKAETKWEAFAKLKGIKKTKRSRMVWDEEKGDWAPRYGYKRANDDTKAWLIPVPENAGMAKGLGLDS